MKILKSTQYDYLKSNSNQNKNLGLIFLIPSIILIIIGLFFLPIIIVGIVLLTIAIYFFNQSGNYSSGIQGEMAVTQALQKLDDSYSLINDLRIRPDRGNIDHIVLSPKGVFVIETKNYTGKISCYGDKWYRYGARKSYSIPSISVQAKENAQNLSSFIFEKTRIRTFVTPICVFVNATSELILNHPTLVILELSQLASYLYQFQPRYFLSDSEVGKISTILLNI
jgi:hypothetical protein